MTAKIKISLLLLVSAGVLAAEVPRKPLPSKYRELWVNSPFTTKPVIEGIKPPNILQDYVLVGVGPHEDGHRVTLLNSKRPNDGRFIVKSGQTNSKGITIDEVIRQDDQRQSDGTSATKVRIKDDVGNVAVVGFDRKYLTIKAPAPAATPKPAPQSRRSSNSSNNGSSNRQTNRTLPPKQLGLTPEQLQQLRNRAQQQRSGNQSGQSSQGRRPILPTSRGNTRR